MARRSAQARATSAITFVLVIVFLVVEAAGAVVTVADRGGANMPRHTSSPRRSPSPN